MSTDTLNILVIEDDDFQRELLIGMLNTMNVRSVTGVGGGNDALSAIREPRIEPFHVALCDLSMPEMDGMAFLRILSQERNDIAVIIVSASDRQLIASVEKLAKLNGIQLLGGIEKPVTAATLERKLATFRPRESSGPVSQPERKLFPLEEILNGIDQKQFEPFFQPKVDFRTNRLVGAEALARWIHPEHGIVAPYSFISPLEESGRIDELTFLMLEKSALACAALHEEGHEITVSVNLSLVSLGDMNLAERITSAARSAGVSPEHLVLEITETAAMTDVSHALENLARLRLNGFVLSIDDYGTGYSSLQQLTRIAFSELKIDQSFVKEVASNPALRIVVESSIDMARKLGVKSVAEGVETADDWALLKSMGCDTAQGYFLAKPMDFKTFLVFCATRPAMV